MDEIKLVGVLPKDVPNETPERETPAVNGATEIRPSRELELLMATGGGGVACW